MAEIVFVSRVLLGRREWRPIPRAGSLRGLETIRVCGLDRPELVDLYAEHVDLNVQPEADRLIAAINAGGAIQVAFDEVRRRLLHRAQVYVHLSIDALTTLLGPGRIAILAGLGLRLEPWA